MDLIEYLLRSFIALTLFYLVYISFLNKETYFKSNRWYLLSSIIIALVFPFINIPNYAPQLSQNFNILIDTVTINGNEINDISSENLSLFLILATIYFTGVGLFSLRFFIQLAQIYRLIKKYKVTYSKGSRIVFIEKEYSPFSFFKYIFINKKQIPDAEFNKIIAHEKVHVKQYHSADLLLFEFLRIIHWFNPLVWFYKYSLTEVHEYLADEGVLQKGFDKNKYQEMLVAESLGVRVNYLNNNFNQSLIKKRIMMMKKMKSTNWAKLKYLIALPVISFVILAFSNGVNKDKRIFDKPENILQTQNEDTTAFFIVEDMPIFRPDKNKTEKEGKRDLQIYISKNVNYPKQSREDGVQGKVYVQFIVNTDGKVINVQVARSSAEKPKVVKKGKHKKNNITKMVKCDATELENEALRVVRSLPDFSPGMQKGKPVKVRFTLPINFRLN